MTIDVEVYGRLVDLLGGARHAVEMPDRPCTVREIAARLARDRPALESALPSLAFAIGDRIVRSDDTLAAGDVLSLLPPVSGG